MAIMKPSSWCLLLWSISGLVVSSRLHRHSGVYGFIKPCPTSISIRPSGSTTPLPWRTQGQEAGSSLLALYAKAKNKRTGGGKGGNKKSNKGGPSGEEGAAPVEGSVMESRSNVGQQAGATKGFGAPPAMSRDEFEKVYDKALEKVTGSKASATERGVVFNPTGPPPPQTTTKTIVRKNINIFTLLPEPVQVGIERFLIGALFINLAVVLGLGVGFSFQAILTTNFDLPEGVKALAETVKTFVDKYDSYFTPSIVTFFLISTLLGSYKIAQLSSEDAVYTEEVPIEEAMASSPPPPQSQGSGGDDGVVGPPPTSPPTEANPWKRDLSRSGPL